MSRPQWDPRLEPYVEFVEQTRGYDFNRPVDVRFADVSEEIAADWEGEVDEEFWSPWTEAYRVLGLYDPAADLAVETGATQQASAAAFYDPAEQVIVLPDSAEVDLVLAETIVHELTHALQHQHGLLLHPFESADSAFVRRALVEGDASRVGGAWVAALPSDQQEAYWRLIDEQDYDPPRDDFLAAQFAAPYLLGEPTVNLIVATDGAEELDRLLRQKSFGTSELLVDPLGDSVRPTLDDADLLPPELLPDDLEYPDGDLGPVVWFQVLAPVVGPETALEALVGFDNDAFAVDVPDVDSDAASCVRFALSFDTATDAGFFADTLDEAGFEAVGEPTGRVVRADQCSAIGDPTDQGVATLLPLVWSAYLVEQYHVVEDEPLDVARCMAIAQAAELPLSIDDAPDWNSVVSAADQFRVSCADA